MSDFSSSEGSDDEYAPIATTSWGDQAKDEAEKPAGDWSSLENPNAKLGPSGLGSGDLHRKGRNYKPIEETLILKQRLKKLSVKSGEGAGRQHRKPSSRPARGGRKVPSSTRGRMRTTFSRTPSAPLRRSSSTTTTTTTTTTFYDYPRKPSIGEYRETAPWEEPPKPKKPSVRFSQPLECPTPKTMHSPKIKPAANPWANKPLMEEPFWQETEKKLSLEPEPPAAVAEPTTVVEQTVERSAVAKATTVIEEQLVEEMEPQPSSHLELSTSTWSSGGVLTPSPVATKQVEPAPWDSPQAENWLDTFTPIETITPPETLSPLDTKPSSPDLPPLSVDAKADSPLATPTTSDSSWQSTTTADTSVDESWGGASDLKTPTEPAQADANAWRPSTHASQHSTAPDKGHADSWNSSSEAVQSHSADSQSPPSTADSWSKESSPWGSTQANDTAAPSWGNNTIAQSWNSSTNDSSSKNNTDAWGSTDNSSKDNSNNAWGALDDTASKSSRTNEWNPNDASWAKESANWSSSAAAADNGWNSHATTTTTTTPPPPRTEAEAPSRFSRSDRAKYSTRTKGPLPANYNNKPLNPPTKVAPPSRVDNPILVTVNVGLSDDKNIPVHIHLYDDPQALARQFARDNGIQSASIVDAVHKLFGNQKAMAMRKRSRPVNTTSSTRHSHPHRYSRY